MAIYIGRDEGEAPGWRGVKIDEDGGEEYSEPFRTKAEALDWESDGAYSEWLASRADENYRQEMIDAGRGHLLPHEE